MKSNEIKTLSENRIWTETERALSSNNPNIYFDILLRFEMHIFHFPGLAKTNCDSCDSPLVRWAELQINNKFALENNLPIPNNFQNALEILKKLVVIEDEANDKNILMVLQKIRFEQNEDLIRKIVLLPHLRKTKDLILRLLEVIKKTDFSILAKVSKEHIEEEKIKLLNQVIKESK